MHAESAAASLQSNSSRLSRVLLPADSSGEGADASSAHDISSSSSRRMMALRRYDRSSMACAAPGMLP
eukprot:scaffold174351_cov29-Tisochrysis_lutea.AAC.4